MMKTNTRFQRQHQAELVPAGTNFHLVGTLLNWRNAILFTHRWMGIVFGLLFLAWFISGVAFMYWGMPNVSMAERMDRQLPLDFSTASVTPAVAASRHNLFPAALSLTMHGERPVYRFGSVAIYADTGDALSTSPVDADRAVEIVRRWVPGHAGTIRYDRFLIDSDQWTLQSAQRSQMPLHRIAVGDERDTYYYVAERTGQVVMKTDRASRIKGFLSGVLHWVYFTPLRKNGYVWNQFIIWGSFAGGLMCLLGLVLGIQRLSLKARFRRRGRPARSPYSGLLCWHHYSGLLFGLVTFTWVLSGAFSVNPFGMFSGGARLTAEQRNVIRGGPFALERIDLEGLQAGTTALARNFPVKEADILQFRGEQYLTATRAPSMPDAGRDQDLEERRMMVSLAHPDRGTFARFDAAAMEPIPNEIMPDVPVRDRVWLNEYDFYYRSRDETRPLPVLRVRYSDDQGTWLYLDPQTANVTVLSQSGRLRRWLYNAMHEFDIPYLYNRRPLWDIVVIGLSVGGVVLAGTTLWPGFRRVARHARRFLRRPGHG